MDALDQLRGAKHFNRVKLKKLESQLKFVPDHGLNCKREQMTLLFSTGWYESARNQDLEFLNKMPRKCSSVVNHDRNMEPNSQKMLSSILCLDIWSWFGNKIPLPKWMVRWMIVCQTYPGGGTPLVFYQFFEMNGCASIVLSNIAPMNMVNVKWMKEESF